MLYSSHSTARRGQSRQSLDLQNVYLDNIGKKRQGLYLDHANKDEPEIGK